jgi:hypothetical protein
MNGALTEDEFWAAQGVTTPPDLNKSWATNLPSNFETAGPEMPLPNIPEGIPNTPSLADTWQAVWEEGNTVGSLKADERNGIDQTPNPTFRLWERAVADGRVDDFPMLVEQNAFNEQMYQAAIANSDRVRKNDETMAAAGWVSFPLQVGAAVFDLPTLIPGGALVRGARLGYSVGKSALVAAGMGGVSAAAQEAGLYATQVDRDGTKWLYGVGGGVVLGGLGGGVVAKLASNVELDRIGKELVEDLTNAQVVDPEKVAARAIESLRARNAGAAEVELTVKDFQIAGVSARTTAKFMAKMGLDPTAQIMTSNSVEAQKVLHGLIETSLVTEQNKAGITNFTGETGGPVEAEIRELRGVLGVAHIEADAMHRDMIKSGVNMKVDDFYEAVGKAMRRGDEDVNGNAYVTRAAKRLREVADEIKRRGNEAGMWDTEMWVDFRTGLITNDASKAMDPTTGKLSTYLHRVYDQTKLVDDGVRFKKIVNDWLDGILPAETIVDADSGRTLINPAWEQLFSDVNEVVSRQKYVEGMVEEIYDRLTGRFTGSDEFHPWQIPDARGPLKDRVLAIPDQMIEDWLESDARIVMQRYTRIASGEIGLRKRFGSATMKDQIAKIDEEYKGLEEAARAAGDNKKALKLRKERDRVIRNIEAFRDMARGVYGRSAQQGAAGAATRSLLTFNFMTSLGGVTISSLPDLAALVGKYGVKAVLMQLLPALATNLKGLKLAKRELQLAGTALEVLNNTRLQSLSEVMEHNVALSKAERGMYAASSMFSKLTLLPHWNDGIKTMAGTMSMNRLVDVSRGFDKANAIDKGWYTQLGLTAGDAKTIAAMVDAGVIKKNGTLWDINTNAWLDESITGVDKIRAKHVETLDKAQKDLDALIASRKAAKRAYDKKTGELSKTAQRDIARYEKEHELWKADQQSKLLRQIDVAEKDIRGVQRRFRWAMAGDTDRSVVTPGMGDKPLWAATNWGKMLLQFKSFMLSANRRLFQSGLQGRQLWLAQHIVLGTAIGAVVSWAKVAEREGTDEANKLFDNPGKLLASGFDRSGTVPFVMEVSNAIGKQYGYNPIMDGMSAVAGDKGNMKVDASRAAAQNAVGVWLGPSVGTLNDIAKISDGLVKFALREDVKKSHVNAVFRQLPYDNLPYWRWYVENYARPGAYDMLGIEE